MAARNRNYAMENAAYQIQYADISFTTERKAEKDLRGVSDVSADPKNSFQKKETNTANLNTEAVYELLTTIQQEKPLFRRMMYLMSTLLVLILLTAVVNLALSLSRLNSSLVAIETLEMKLENLAAQEDKNKPSPEAIQTLETKMENLPALVNETCPRTPPVAIETLEMKLENLAKLVNETCPRTTAVPSSCKELYERNPSLKSNVYKLRFGSQEIPVYCHMGNFGCGNGGWTMAMKINGSKKTFHYNSNFWRNKEAYNLPGGETGFDKEETKLPTYWVTPFSKICLGMRINQQINFVAVNKDAFSLYSLIADGKYRATSLRRNTWKSLIGSAGSLQRYCNMEGFNVRVSSSIFHSKARIGILGKNENNCRSSESRIGFGIGGKPDDSNTCGNEAISSPDNGNRHIKAMGYILIQ